MVERVISRRNVLIGGVAVGGAAALAAVVGNQPKREVATGPSPSAPSGGASPSDLPSVEPSPSELGGFPIYPVEGALIVTDPALYPTTLNETPGLADKVASGDLPPIAERVGSEPLVIKPTFEIGKHGGTLRRGLIGGADDTRNADNFASGPTTLFARDARPEELPEPLPYIAKALEISPDGTTFTVTLRKGMKWSDGEPFTADDIMFWYEDIYRNDAFGLYPDIYWQVDGKDIEVERVDDLTVRFSGAVSIFLDSALGFDQVSNPDGAGPYMPKHYLKQFHADPKYGGKAAESLGKDAGMEWPDYLLDRSYWQLNADLPVLLPWKVVKGRELNSGNFALERNPFSIWVDTAGNQLPYIDMISFKDEGDADSLALTTIAGEYDWQDRGLTASKLSLLYEHQEDGNYNVYLDPTDTVDYGLRVNLSYHKDDVIGDLLRTADFRRALSMGIDRDQINDAFFLSAGTPTSYAAQPGTQYFAGEDTITKWSTLDLDQANKLLDGLGLTMGGDGFRQRSDGKRLRLEYSAANPARQDFLGMGEMIKEQWTRIGVDLAVQGVAGPLITERALANDLQLAGHAFASDDVFLTPYTCFPSDESGYQAANGILYSKWFNSNGKDGEEPFKELKDLMALWKEGYSAPLEQRVETGKQFWRDAIDLCLQIGCVGQTISEQAMHVTKKNLGNVARRIPPLGSLSPVDAYFKA